MSWPWYTVMSIFIATAAVAASWCPSVAQSCARLERPAAAANQVEAVENSRPGNWRPASVEALVHEVL